jgi:flagellar motor switch protein FliM
MSDVVDQEANVRRYDFCAEQNPAHSRMPNFEPTLEMINYRFSRLLRSALLQYLQRGVEVTPTGVEMVAHRELLERLTLPSYLTLVTIKPLQGTIAIVGDARLVVAIVESRFGGNGRFPVTTVSREFSPFEQKSMRRVVEMALAQYALAWQPVGRFEPEIIRHEVNPQYAGFAGPEDPVVVSAFDIRIDSGGGTLLTCIPAAAVEPIHDRLVLGIAEEPAEGGKGWCEALTAVVGGANITLNVELAGVEISVGDLVALRPGNVFEIGRPESLTVEAHGVPLFRGRWGRYGRKIGVRIEERLVPAADVLAMAPPRGKEGSGHG